MQPRALTKAVGAATPESLSAGIGHPKSSHTRAAGFLCLMIFTDYKRAVKRGEAQTMNTIARLPEIGHDGTEYATNRIRIRHFFSLLPYNMTLIISYLLSETLQ